MLNAMMNAYIDCDINHEAINLFMIWSKCNLNPDVITYRTIFRARNNAALVENGGKLHSQIKADNHGIC